MSATPSGHDAPMVRLGLARSTHPAGVVRVVLDIDDHLLELTRAQAQILGWLLRRIVNRLRDTERSRP